MTDPEVLKRIVAGVNVGTDQEKLRRKVKEERVARNTYLSHAGDVETELGGRFAKLTPTQVVGSEPTVNYPKLSEGPWSEGPPGGDEPLIDGTGESNRLGYRIDGGQEPTDEVFEREPGAKGFKRRV